MEFPTQAIRGSDSKIAKMREVLIFLREIKTAKQSGPGEPGMSQTSAGVPPSNATAFLSRQRTELPAGELLPSGDLSARFRRLSPPGLSDIAPQGMELPLDVGYNNRPASDASRVAVNRLRLAAAITSLDGDLKYKLFNHYLGNTGGTQELPARDANAIQDALTHRSSSFMAANVEQLMRRIEAQIDTTGQTSGKVRSSTDWRTTRVQNYESSLGHFSAKLVYDLEYSQNPDGSIKLSGDMSVAIQDLYDFGNRPLSTPVPATGLPDEFRKRENFTAPGGELTDLALGALQREGLVAPFYVIGMARSRKVEINFDNRSNAISWTFSG